MDLRNHGLSGHDPVMDYATMAKDVTDTLNALNFDTVDLLGHSMGGKVAMQLAVQYPQRLRSILVADIAPVAYEPRHQAILAGLKAINLVTLKSRKEALKVLLQYEPDQRACQFLLKGLYKTHVGDFALRYNLSAILNNYPAISAAPTLSEHASIYKGPALVLKGENSAYILSQHKASYDQLLPNSTLKIMADCGHWLHAEKPELFSRLVSRFLNGLT
jgi:esterase